jgi:hypothetical protein
MAASLEETLTSVWRQALVEEAKSVMLDNRSFPVRRTSRSRLREVDFQFEGHGLRGLEQNPKTGSRWAQLPRQGKKVMQFLERRRYVGVVVDGRVHFYGQEARHQLEQRDSRFCFIPHLHASTWCRSELSLPAKQSRFADFYRTN